MDPRIPDTLWAAHCLVFVNRTSARCELSTHVRHRLVMHAAIMGLELPADDKIFKNPEQYDADILVEAEALSNAIIHDMSSPGQPPSDRYWNILVQDIRNLDKVKNPLAKYGILIYDIITVYNKRLSAFYDETARQRRGGGPLNGDSCRRPSALINRTAPPSTDA